MKKLPILFKNQFESEDLAQRVLQASYPGIAQGGKIFAGVITLFEVLLVIRTIFWGSADWSKNAQYISCYLFLIAASTLMLFLTLKWSKDFKKYGAYFYCMQVIYNFAIATWAVRITLLDGYYHDDFDVIVYMTIMLILPAITFINPLILVGTQLVGDILVFVGILHEGAHGRIINFGVYCITSVIACLLYHFVKKSGYIKQCRLQERAIHDPLTKMLNRQTLNENEEAIWEKCKRLNQPVSVIMADIDLFKRINDQYGHLAGDRIIVDVAKAFMDACKNEEYSCYRYGGEEFLMLLPGADQAAAIAKTEEITSLIQSITENDVDHIHVTASFGVYTGEPTEGENLRQYLSHADKLLYQSKANGRNRYTVNN